MILNECFLKKLILKQRQKRRRQQKHVWTLYFKILQPFAFWAIFSWLWVDSRFFRIILFLLKHSFRNKLQSFQQYWPRSGMRGSREFCHRGSKFEVFFCFGWGEGGSKYTFKWATIGPPAKRHLNGILLACRWWPNIECFMICQGIRTWIAKTPIFLWFSGVGADPPVPL